MSAIRRKVDTSTDHSSFGMVGAVALGGAVIAADRARDDLFYWAEHLKYSRIYSGIAAPLCALRILGHVKQIVVGDKNAKMDAGFGILGESSLLSYNLSNILTTLRDMEYLGDWTIEWAEKLMTISVPLQLGRLVFNVRLHGKLNQCIHELGLKKEKWEPQDFENLQAYVVQEQNANLLMRRFYLQDKGSIGKIFSNFNEEKKEILQNRAWSMQLSSKLRVSANITVLVASLIFLTNPLSTTIFFLYLQGAVIGTAAYVIDAKSQHQFAKALKMPGEDCVEGKLLRFVGGKLHAVNHQFHLLGEHLKDAILTQRAACRARVKSAGFSYIQ